VGSTLWTDCQLSPAGLTFQKRPPITFSEFTEAFLS
jgi:hypothetical protein